MTPDSAAINEDYAKRAVELGHGILSSVEHGWQGYYYETYELAQKYGLKFVFGAEAYWVKDRFEKDRTNSHIILLARNEAGRRQINSVLADANIEGYYYKPRVDLQLLLTLNPADVVVTSACIAFWNYDDIEEIVERLHNHFGDSFYLEVQYHHTEKQVALNKKIMQISKTKGIEIIAGLDSHYIFPEQAQERQYILEAKKTFYDDEEGWFMDYPNDEEIFKRFQDQGVLSDEEIRRAMDNTNVTLTFDDIHFSKDIKLPVLPKYKNRTKEEREKIYSKLITKQFKEYTKGMDKETYRKYFQGVKEEVDVYKNTGMCDYPLIDYEIIKTGVEMGGVITNTGRGSAPGFFTNTLCGFSKIDRFVSPIKLYPERFMSETRILETHSLPDIDMNLGTPEIFEQAQIKVMGEGHAYPMIAFGTVKKKSAFKMYARARGMDFELANDISKQIEVYEKDLSYASDEDKDQINIYDYVDKQYHEYLDQSQSYWGIVEQKKKAPCAFLLYDGDIKSEIGLIKCKSESTKKEYITTVIDGAIAEKYKFLKNDLLKVNTVLLTDLVYKRIGMNPHTVTELSKAVSEDHKVWRIYGNGYTVGVNQCEQDAAKKKIVRYKPKNISELAAFIAGIRPGFKSMYDLFESRQPFSYGIKPFDDLIQTEEFPYSFILYQEQLMTTLNYAGFPMDQCYQIIKDIAKKHPEKVLPLKKDFLIGFKEKILPDCQSEEEAEEMSQKVWEIVYNNTSYGFNSAHAYAMALDSLYCAWQKANYPYEFYETYLQFYTDEGEKDKVAELKQEMETAFSIKEGDYRFGIDNRKFKADKESQQIIPSLTCLKGISQKCSDKIYELSKKQYDNFAELWIEINKASGINKGHVEKLIKIDYFKQFGSMEKIIEFNSMALELNDRNQFNKTKDAELIKKYRKYINSNYCEETDSLFRKFDYQKALIAIWKDLCEIETKSISIPVRLNWEFEIIGYLKSKYKVHKSYAYVIDVNKTFPNKVVQLYRLRDGEIETVKIKKAAYDKLPVEQKMIIKTIDVSEERRWKKQGDDWVRIDEMETILRKWSIVQC